MLKCAMYGCRPLSSTEDAFFGSVADDHMRTGLHRETEAQVLIDAGMVVAGARRPHGHEAHALAVQHHLDVVGPGDALDMFVAVALQANGDVIVGVLRERCTS